MNSISIRPPSLEDVFIYLTGKKLDDSGNNETRTRPREKSTMIKGAWQYSSGISRSS